MAKTSSILRGPYAFDADDEIGRIASFAAPWSLEATLPSAADIEAVAAIAPPATEVYLSAVANKPRERVLEAARRVRAAGLEPVPHIAARMFESRAALDAFLARATGEIGVVRALVIAGDRDAPAGPFADALAVIESGLLQQHGITRIGISGYPDGHPRIKEDELARAFRAKRAAASAGGLDVHIVTQFCFDPDRVMAWLYRMGNAARDVPIKIGMAGPTGIATLLRYALRCGVNTSVRGLSRNAGMMGRLLGDAAPDAIMRALAEAGADDNNVTPHFFSFGGLVATAQWARAVANGAIALDPASGGFRVVRR
ncbi:MAG: methylenetetrahydrofolate reductase [Alphaproteobacteria bacterium]